jgi:hypothetical protein
MRALACAMIALGALGAVVLAAACGKQLNPAFCDDHPDDIDCRNSGTVAIDAPMGECTASSMCAGNPNGNVCDVASQSCVQCILGVDATHCTGMTPQCGEDNQCHGCTLDAHCTASSVCLPSGMCADEATVLYARPNGTGNCTQAGPCTFTTAIAMVTQTRHIIKLTANNGTVYKEPPLTFDVPAIGIQVLGYSATYEPNAGGDAITVSDGNVDFVGLTIQRAVQGGDGIACSGATLGIHKAALLTHSGYGLSSNGCNVTVDRTRFEGNPSGAMTLTAGKLEIRNNILDKNGTDTLDKGNIFITNSSGRVAFNTIVLNLSRNGGGRVGGIDCTPAAGQTMLITRNIISDNGGGTTFGGTCTTGTTNYTGKVTDIKFANLTDFKLTAMSPTTILRDDPEAGPDCLLVVEPPKYIDDFEGQTRPAGFCDRGADEYKP